MTAPLWQPSAERIAASNMQRFIDRVAANLARPDYASLHAWSVTDPAGFWDAAWDTFAIRAATRHHTVLADADRMPGARWFEGARLNFAENLLKPEHDAAAIIAYDETGRRAVLSRAQLTAQVASIAQALRSFGVGPGDRVAGYLPNGPETVVAMLATASLGAVWSACSPDFGTDGLVDRLGQIDAKVLFATDGYRYNGKLIDCLPRVSELVRRLDGLQQLVLVPNNDAVAARAAFPDAPVYADLVQVAADLQFTAVPFSQPLYIL
jgi:acetoacetyl-CoA synthetase